MMLWKVLHSICDMPSICNLLASGMCVCVCVCVCTRVCVRVHVPTLLMQMHRKCAVTPLFQVFSRLRLRRPFSQTCS